MRNVWHLFLRDAPFENWSIKLRSRSLSGYPLHSSTPPDTSGSQRLLRIPIWRLPSQLQKRASLTAQDLASQGSHKKKAGEKKKQLETESTKKTSKNGLKMFYHNGIVEGFKQFNRGHANSNSQKEIIII